MTFFKHLSLLLVLLSFKMFLGGNLVFAQSTKIHFDVYNDENSSIPHNSINAIAFENNSVWIATGGGLVHWTATDSTIYTPRNSPLKDYGIKTIAVGDNGNKYIGTYGKGIFKLDSEGKFTHLKLRQKGSKNKNTVISIIEDKNGVVWFGTEEKGLYRVADDFKSAQIVENDMFNRVFEIWVDNENTKWIATENGLYTLGNSSSQKPNRLKPFPKYKGHLINSLAFTEEGKLIVSITTHDKAELYIDGRAQRPSSKIHYQFRKMLAENKHLWAASMTGLGRFANNSWQIFSPDNSSFPSRSVSTIVQNPYDESIWIGTYGKGLACIVEKQQQMFEFGNLAITRGEIVSLKVEFERGKAIFKDTTGLSDVVQLLKKYPNLSIELGGHTDNIGDMMLNYKLSQDRADAVKLVLISKGISAARIRTKAYGGSRPISKGRTPAERQANRRVEIKVID